MQLADNTVSLDGETKRLLRRWPHCLPGLKSTLKTRRKAGNCRKGQHASTGRYAHGATSIDDPLMNDYARVDWWPTITNWSFADAGVIRRKNVWVPGEAWGARLYEWLNTYQGEVYGIRHGAMFYRSLNTNRPTCRISNCGWGNAVAKTDGRFTRHTISGLSVAEGDAFDKLKISIVSGI